MQLSKTYREMTDSEIKEAARIIIRTSSSEDEVRRRIRDVLGYPYGIAITSHLPTDVAGCEARKIVHALGGLTMANGAMVMAMMHGHDSVISL